MKVRGNTAFQAKKLSGSLVNLYYGKLPEIHRYTNRVATGKYETLSKSFLESMQREGEQTKKQNIIAAASKLDTLLHGDEQKVKKMMQETQCPICMESLLPPNNQNTNDEVDCHTTASAMSESVAYGACGHLFCGECADNLQKVCLENLVTGNNDYGMGDNSVNRPRCPMCRHAWDTGSPPLLVSLNPKVEFAYGKEGVYKIEKGLKNRELEWASANPTVRSMREALSKSVKAVIVCGTKGLAAHLCTLANRGKECRAVYVSSEATRQARSNALRLFRDPTSGIRELYLSQMYMHGIGFSNVKDFFLAERLEKKHRLSFYLMVYSSWCSTDGDPQMRVHTFDSVNPKGQHGRTMLSPLLCSVPERNTELRWLLTSMKNEGKCERAHYISEIMSYFDNQSLKQVETTPRQSHHCVVPIQLSSVFVDEDTDLEIEDLDTEELVAEVTDLLDSEDDTNNPFEGVVFVQGPRASV